MAISRNNASHRGGPRPRRDRPKYVPRRRVCAFCADKSKVIDFRDAAKLRRYLSDRAKIEGRRKTATCAKHQREMALAIKRARHLALLPFTLAHIRQTGGAGFRMPTLARQPLPPVQHERPPAPQAQAPAAPVAQAPAGPSAAQQPTAPAESGPAAA